MPSAAEIYLERIWNDIAAINLALTGLSPGSHLQVDVLTWPTGIVYLGAGAANIGKVDPNIATPTVYNLTLTNANTEYSQAMPANCRGFEFLCRTAFDCRFAFVTGKVATPTAPYMTLKSGYVYSSPDLSQGASPSTLYFASATAAVVMEIMAWV